MTVITFLFEAEEELNYSAQYYNQQSSGLGLDFLEEIENSLKNIKQAPGRCAVYEKNIRKYNVNRFPFSLYYVFEKER
jgi:hypothetical protein